MKPVNSLFLAAFVFVLSAVNLSRAEEPPVRKAEAIARAYVAELKAKPSLWPEVGEKQIRERFGHDAEHRDAPRIGLQALLNDPDADVRESAANLLGRLGDKEAATALIGTLKDKSKRVRSRAALALGEIGNRIAVDPLIETLKKDPDALVRLCVAQSFANMPDRRAVPVLVESLGKDRDEDVRRDAGVALGVIGGKEAIAALQRALLDKNDRVRMECEDALARLGSLSLPLPEQIYSDVDYAHYEQVRGQKELKREVHKEGKIYFEEDEYRELTFPNGVRGWFKYRSWQRCTAPEQAGSKPPPK